MRRFVSCAYAQIPTTCLFPTQRKFIGYSLFRTSELALELIRNIGPPAGVHKETDYDNDDWRDNPDGETLSRRTEWLLPCSCAHHRPYRSPAGRRRFHALRRPCARRSG